MNQVQLCFGSDGQSIARVTIPSPTLRRRREVFETITNGLPGLANDVGIEPDGEGHVVLSIVVYPHAERDTRDRMLLAQWAVKRLAEFSPPIDATNLREVQRQLC